MRQEEVLWAVLTHLSLFVLAVIAPLVVYLVQKNASPFVRAHAAEALNFHLTLLIAGILCVPLMLVLVGLLLLPVVVVGGMVLAVVAAVAAGDSRPYRYPLTIRFVS